MLDHQRAFVDLALSRSALRFGEFRLKSGRDSPYFFNAGAFSDGEAIAVLGQCYATALIDSGVAFDLLFGPAYKGIPLVTATAIALATRHGRRVPWSFNRKEAKDHGEGGVVVGSRLAGRVVIVDDVITAGTAIRESVEIIRAAGAQPVAVALALDRQERGEGPGGRSALQEVETDFGLRCIPILRLDDLIEGEPGRITPDQASALRAYRARYGIA